MDLEPEHAPSVRHLVCLGTRNRLARIDQPGDYGRAGNKLMQQSQSLRLKLVGEDRDPGDVASRAVETGDQAELHWIAADREDDRNRRGCRLGGERRGVGPGEQHGHFPIDQVGGERRQSIVLTIGKAVLDCNILPFDIAGLVQTPVKRGDGFRPAGRGWRRDRALRGLRRRQRRSEWPWSQLWPPGQHGCPLAWR